MANDMKLSDDVKDMLQQQNSFLFEHMQKLRTENLKLHKLVCAHRWGHRIMERNPETAEYLTGLSYDLFKWFLRFSAPHVTSQTHASLADQLMLMLMKIKLDIPDAFLAKLFNNVSSPYALRIEIVLESWFTKLNQVCSKLILWPERKNEKEEEYILNIIELSTNMYIAIVFTSAGAICFVSEAVSCDPATFINQLNLLEKVSRRDKIFDIRNGVCYAVVMSKSDGVSQLKLSKNVKQDFTAMTKARRSVNAAMEKLSTFAVFSRGFKEFRHVNMLVKISAAIANLQPAKPLH